MNKVFRIIGSKKRRVRGWPVLRVGVLITAAFLATTGTAFSVGVYIDPANELPTGWQLTSGGGSTKTVGNKMTITQTSPQMIANWNTFNIGSSAGVTFKQPNASATALNRISDLNPSRIMGSLSSNGTVFLLNQSGIIFGSTAQVNVGGLVASSFNMADSDFLAGKYNFSNPGNAGNIENDGGITAGQKGIVALIAPKVTNTGTITANSGSVLEAAGYKVSLTFNGDGQINYTVDQGIANALAENSGKITAKGGTVVLTAEAVDAIQKAVVNNTGIIEASTLQSMVPSLAKSGKILLLSDKTYGTTNVGGTLNASAPNGGNGGLIESSGATVNISNTAAITTAAPKGKTGTWVIDPASFTVSASGGDMTPLQLSNGLVNNNVIIKNSSNGGGITINNDLSWGSLNNIDLVSLGNINVNANLTAPSGSLTLEYGQGAPAAGNTSQYSLAAGKSINLSAGPNFGTRLGSDGSLFSYQVITSLADLQNINNNLNKNYAIGSNIDATPTAGWNGSQGFTPIGIPSAGFNAVFDGLGHTVNGLVIKRPSQDYVGLFGLIGGTIRNISLTNESIAGNVYVGGLVGLKNGGTISNSKTSGPVTGNYEVGGLTGHNDGTISNSTASGPVTGNYEVGGLAGHNDGAISNSSASGTVTGTNNVGGLVGYNNGFIENSTGSGAVSGSGLNVGGLVGGNMNTIQSSTASGQVTGNYEVGALAGHNDGAISNSSASGTASGTNNVGGLVGYNNGFIENSNGFGAVSGSGLYVGGLVGDNVSTIQSSTASGQVTGNYEVGGLAGHNDGFIQNSSASGTVSGTSNVGGLVGYNNGTIAYITASGTVTGTLGVGGLVGLNGGTISNSTASGIVIGSVNRVGGLVGDNGGNINSSTASGDVTGFDFVGGLVGYNTGNVNSSTASGTVSGSGVHVGLQIGYPKYP